jgi:hypothetical protein
VSVLESLVAICEPWATLYGNSTPLSVTLTFVHLGAMMVGGGLALSADRLVLSTPSGGGTSARSDALRAVGQAHRPVVIALFCSALSGGLQLAADLESLADNKIMWVKFGLLLALALNGLLMLRDERSLVSNAAHPTALRALKNRAIVSGVLWFAIVLAGVGLMQG